LLSEEYITYRLRVHTSRFNNQNSLDKEKNVCSIPRLGKNVW